MKKKVTYARMIEIINENVEGVLAFMSSWYDNAKMIEVWARTEEKIKEVSRLMERYCTSSGLTFFWGYVVKDF